MEGKCGGKIVKMKRREGGVGGKLSAEKYQRWEKHKKNPNRRRRQLLLWGFV